MRENPKDKDLYDPTKKKKSRNKTGLGLVDSIAHEHVKNEVYFILPSLEKLT